jgi:hypothetical protein
LSQFGKVTTGKTNNSITELGQKQLDPNSQYADNMNAVVSLPKDTMNCMSDANGVLKELQ